MGMWTLLPVLAAVAALLSGCGSSDKKSKVDNSPADFVSQSLQGKITGHIKVNTSAFAPQGKVSVYLDADNMDFRVEAEVTDESASGAVGIILNLTEKRVTLWANQSVGVIKFRGCRWVDLKMIPLSAADIRTLIKSRLQSQKPSGMDGDFRKFSTTVQASAFGSASLTGEFDSSNVLHKGTLDATVQTGATTANIGGEFDADEATGGEPDASIFQVPASWAPCTEIKPGDEELALFQDALQDKQPVEAATAAVVV